MFDVVLSRFKPMLMKQELDLDYQPEVTLKTFLASPIPLILVLSVSLIVGGMLVMISQAAKNGRMIEQIRSNAIPQRVNLLTEQNQQLMEDRKRLDGRLETAEKNQAKVQKALENAQRSFNEARDVLRRIEKSKAHSE